MKQSKEMAGLLKTVNEVCWVSYNSHGRGQGFLNLSQEVAGFPKTVKRGGRISLSSHQVTGFHKAVTGVVGFHTTVKGGGSD